MDKSKVMVIGKERMPCRILLDSEQLEKVSEFKYLGYMLDEKGTDDAECSRIVMSGKKVAGAIRALVNERGLSLDCVRILHESMLLPVLLYGSECMVWDRTYRSKVQAVQMDNLRSVLGVKKIDKIRNEFIRTVCGVEKGINERVNESVLRWFGHVERMDDSRMVKRMYKGECIGRLPKGRMKKR